MAFIFSDDNSVSNNKPNISASEYITINNYADVISFYNEGKLDRQQVDLLYSEASFDNNYFPVDFKIQKQAINISYYEEELSFRNNDKFLEIKNYPYSKEYEFSNGYEKSNSIYLNSFALSFSDFIDFGNGVIETKDINGLKFSTGIFPFEEKFYAFVDDNLDYYDIKAMITNEAATSYWFDNSVPSHKELIQAKVIPWGIDQRNIQLAYKFPYYATNFEFDVSSIETNSPVNLETDIYPYEDATEVNNIEFDTIFGSFVVDFQWALGEEAITSFNIEYERIEGTVYPLSIQLDNVIRDSSKLHFQYSAGYESKEVINFEFDEFVTMVGYTDFEFSSGYNTEDNFNFEYERTDDTVYPLSLEWVGKVDLDYKLGLEFINVYNDNSTLDFQFRRAYNIEENVPMEFDTPISKDFGADLELYVSSHYSPISLEFINVYNEDFMTNIETDVADITKTEINNIEYYIENIWNDRSLDFQFRRAYHIDESTNMEYNIDDVSKQYDINFETLLRTNYEVNTNLEFLKPKESKVNIEEYVVPLGYGSEFIQITHIAVSKPATDIEFNVEGIISDKTTDIEASVIINVEEINNIEVSIPTIWKDEAANMEVSIPDFWADKSLPLEFRTVYHDFEDIDLEFNASINKDYLTNLETEISINKAYELTLEYVQKISDETGLDLEFNSVINTEVDLHIEYIVDRLSHDFDLDLEFFISATQNFGLDLELFVNTVSKSLNLEIDVLDLVYYFIRQGHNILPWTYSDGKGNYDGTINKDWNKLNEDESTFMNSFVNQIQDKGLTLPNITQYSDNRLENWGTIITGIQDKNIGLSNKFLYYENIDTEHILVMGKRKREALEIVELMEGENLLIWDGVFSSANPPMFSNNIGVHIDSKIDNVQFWDQRIGTWKTLIGNEDHPLYFEQVVENSLQPMPFIMNIKVKEDCTFEIHR